MTESNPTNEDEYSYSDYESNDTASNVNRRSVLRTAGAASAAGLIGLPAFTGNAVASEHGGKPCHKDFACTGEDTTYVKFEFDEDACEFVEETSTGLIEITDWSPECDPTYVEWDSSLGDVTTVMAFGGTDCDTVDDPGESYNADQAGEAGLDNPGGQTAAISNLQFCVAPLELPSESYIGYEDRPITGDFDYNDFGMRAGITETYPAGTLESIEMEFEAVAKTANDDHEIHIERLFDNSVEYDYTISRSGSGVVDGGAATPAGNYSGSGDLDIVLFDTTGVAKTSSLDDVVEVSVAITSGSVSPPTNSPRPDVAANNVLFEVYNPYMENLSQSLTIRLETIQDNVSNSDVKDSPPSWDSTSDVPNIIVVPDPDFVVPAEDETITEVYPEFIDYYGDDGGDTDNDLDVNPAFDDWFETP